MELRGTVSFFLFNCENSWVSYQLWDGTGP